MTFAVSRQWRIWWQLLKRDLYVFRSDSIDYMVNTLWWPIQGALAFGYVFPLMGVSTSYGAHILLTTVVYKCMYESYFQASTAVADINNTRSFDFIVTLPISAPMIAWKNVAYFVIRCFILCPPILIISKILLQDRFPLEKWNPLHSVVTLFTVALFFALFTIWLTGWVKNQMGFEHVWVRLLDTLSIWGGFWFPWQTLFAFNKTLAYFTLLNPFTLGTEALRNSFFGTDAALPFWPCIAGLLLESSLLAVIGYRRLKKRLDFVD
jgi:hypothetical protein